MTTKEEARYLKLTLKETKENYEEILKGKDKTLEDLQNSVKDLMEELKEKKRRKEQKEIDNFLKEKRQRLGFQEEGEVQEINKPVRKQREEEKLQFDNIPKETQRKIWG